MITIKDSARSIQFHKKLSDKDNKNTPVASSKIKL